MRTVCKSPFAGIRFFHGAEGEQPAHEQPGGTGTEPSVASTIQAVVSPGLDASLSCVETYANAGTCDWAHWSELWETCQTYEHPELEDGVFLDAVQSGDCTAANWPTLRAQLIAPRPPLVRVREACNGGSQVIQEVESNGCYTLPDAAGASFVDVPLGKTVTLHAGAACTGDSVTVQTDASLCETSFESGAAANDNVRSFRVEDVAASSSEFRYDCAGDPTCVENFNSKSVLAAINKKHTVRVVRVTLAGRTTPAVTTIQNTVRDLYAFYAVASRGQVSLDLLTPSQTVAVTSTQCDAAKKQAVQKSNSSAFMTVYVLPSGLCSFSNTRPPRIYLNDNLFRTYAHEAGHRLGLAHGNTGDPDVEGDATEYGDSSTYMGKFVSDNYDLPQLHWLGWTKMEELVKVNSAIAGGSSIDVTIRPVGDNANSTSSLPLGAVWDIPGTDDRIFVAVPKPRTNGTNQIEGGTVFAYLAHKCVGCRGIAMGSWVLARFIPSNRNEHEVRGLVIQVVGATSRFVTVDGKSVEEFTSVTLRLRKKP